MSATPASTAATPPSPTAAPASTPARTASATPAELRLGQEILVVQNNRPINGRITKCYPSGVIDALCSPPDADDFLVVRVRPQTRPGEDGFALPGHARLIPRPPSLAEQLKLDAEAGRRPPRPGDKVRLAFLWRPGSAGPHPGDAKVRIKRARVLNVVSASPAFLVDLEAYENDLPPEDPRAPDPVDWTVGSVAWGNSLEAPSLPRIGFGNLEMAPRWFRSDDPTTLSAGQVLSGADFSPRIRCAIKGCRVPIQGNSTLVRVERGAATPTVAEVCEACGTSMESGLDREQQKITLYAWRKSQAKQ